MHAKNLGTFFAAKAQRREEFLCNKGICLSNFEIHKMGQELDKENGNKARFKIVDSWRMKLDPPVLGQVSSTPPIDELKGQSSRAGWGMRKFAIR